MEPTDIEKVKFLDSLLADDKWSEHDREIISEIRNGLSKPNKTSQEKATLYLEYFRVIANFVGSWWNSGGEGMI